MLYNLTIYPNKKDDFWTDILYRSKPLNFLKYHTEQKRTPVPIFVHDLGASKKVHHI